MHPLLNKSLGYNVPASASKQGTTRKHRMLQGPKMSNQLNTSIPEEEQQADVAMPHGAKTLYPKNAIRVHTSGNQSVHGR